MSTVQVALPRRFRHRYVFGLIAVLCVAAVVAAIVELRPAPHRAAVVAIPAANDGVAGGRAGGINSADTATDGSVREELSAAAPAVNDGVAGGRAGGINSADTAADASTRDELSAAAQPPAAPASSTNFDRSGSDIPEAQNVIVGPIGGEPGAATSVGYPGGGGAPAAAGNGTGELIIGEPDAPASIPDLPAQPTTNR